MSPESREALGGPAGILEKRDQVTTRAGNEVMVLEEKMTWRKGMPQFWHEGTFDAFNEPLVLRWVMDDKGAIIGLGLGPRSHTPEVDPAPPTD